MDLWWSPSVPAGSVLGKESCHLWLRDHSLFLMALTSPLEFRMPAGVSKESMKKALFSRKDAFSPPHSLPWIIQSHKT